MYEDVCLQCGKPVTDGRAYCSYDCESLDTASPSISTASSNFPSPHLGFTMSPTPDGDIPALLPTALGGSGGPLQSYSRYRSINNHPAAIPRYSALSAWSSGQYTEDESEHPDHATLFDPNEKHPSSGLNYARKPSSTNWHSLIPRPHVVHASNSGASSPVRSSVGVPQSVPSLALPPTPPSSGADDELSDGTNDKGSTLRTTKTTSLVTKASASKKRNRASLPAYFSLLALTSSPGNQRSQRIPPAAGVSTSRNIPKSSHVKTAPSTTAITPTTVHANQPDSCSSAFEASFRGRAERGRSRHRGPGSSTSPGARNDSRKRSPVRRRIVVSPSKSSTTVVVPISPCLPTLRRRQRGHRIKSHEKVSDWIPTNAEPEPRLRSRSRRYSNESDESEDRHWRPMDTATCGRGVDGERRGRRRTNELDPPLPGDVNGPGFGSGRSGLRDRERRGAAVQGLVH